MFMCILSVAAGQVFSRLITLLGEVLPNNTWKIQVAVLGTLTIIFTR